MSHHRTLIVVPQPRGQLRGGVRRGDLAQHEGHLVPEQRAGVRQPRGQGLDRLETLLLLAVRNKASAWIVSSLINIGAHHYILLQGTTPPWWQR